jgi:hypothetical protein
VPSEAREPHGKRDTQQDLLSVGSNPYGMQSVLPPSRGFDAELGKRVHKHVRELSRSPSDRLTGEPQPATMPTPNGIPFYEEIKRRAELTSTVISYTLGGTGCSSINHN